MIGFPEDAMEHMLRWADQSFQSVGPLNERTLGGFPVIEEMFQYLMGVSEADFVEGGLGRAMFDAARAGELAEAMVVPMLWNFTGPAMDTTISTIGHAVWRFATNPRQWDLVRKDPSLVPQALLEVLRLDAPIQMFTRLARRTVDIEGVEIPEGGRVAVLYGSANRDERHFPEPDVFDVRRNPTDHLSFGYGLHACVGQGLARMEMNAVFAAFAETVESFRLDDPDLAERHLNNVIRSFERMPVTVAPVA
jgi:cytochrome P450